MLRRISIYLLPGILCYEVFKYWLHSYRCNAYCLQHGPIDVPTHEKLLNFEFIRSHHVRLSSGLRVIIRKRRTITMTSVARKPSRVHYVEPHPAPISQVWATKAAVEASLLGNFRSRLVSLTHVTSLFLRNRTLPCYYNFALSIRNRMVCYAPHKQYYQSCCARQNKVTRASGKKMGIPPNAAVI